LLCERVGGG